MLLSRCAFFLWPALAVVAVEPYLGTRIGKLNTHFHGVSGEVYAVDEKTLYLKDFHYDGTGPGGTEPRWMPDVHSEGSFLAQMPTSGRARQRGRTTPASSFRTSRAGRYARREVTRSLFHLRFLTGASRWVPIMAETWYYGFRAIRRCARYGGSPSGVGSSG